MGSADQEPDEAVGGVRKRSHKTIILLAFAASATLFAQPGPAVRQAAAQVGRYRLQSNSWVNLHQRLIHEARFETAPPAALSGDDLSRWKKAVETYRAFLGKRNPIFDRELIGMNAALSETSTPEPPGSIPKAALAAEAVLRHHPPCPFGSWLRAPVERQKITAYRRGVARGRERESRA